MRVVGVLLWRMRIGIPSRDRVVRRLNLVQGGREMSGGAGGATCIGDGGVDVFTRWLGHEMVQRHSSLTLERGEMRGGDGWKDADGRCW